MHRICKIHNLEYNYVCQECLKPFLINTSFSNLKEIREYQKRNAENIILVDKNKNFNLIGIIKVRFIEDLAYSGILLYNLKEKKIINSRFKSFKPIFTEYFPSFLFLNQTEIYLDLIKDLEIIPDCYIMNSSGQIHPYFYGAACDFGLKIDTPVIGYTKKLLFGEIRENKENPEVPGIYHENRLIGYAIPKISSKKFLYISVGNNISIQTAKNLFFSIDLKFFSTLSTRLNNFIRSSF